MADLIGKHATSMEISMRLLDIGTLIVSGQVASLIHFGGWLDKAMPIHSILLYFCGVLAFILFEKQDLYRSWRGRPLSGMTARIAVSWASVLLIGLFFSFLIHRIGDVSRVWLFYWFLIGTASVTLLRWLIHAALRHLRKKGMNSKRVAIIGYGPIGQEMHRQAEAQDWVGYEVVAVFADDDEKHGIDWSRVARICTLERLPQIVEEYRLDEVWITLSFSASAQLQRLQYLLRNALIDIRWVPDTIGIRMLSSKMGDFLGFPAVDLNRPTSSGLNGIAKDLFDKLFSLTALIFLSPVFVAIAIGIKKGSAGPVFFSQPRHGLNGKRFNVYKFRTMKLHQDRGEIKQASRNDDRITPFGKFLRRTSLDELPQFINVLLGDMSIVGPRPHALQHNDLYKERLELYMLRHRVKPGITGWAQIHGCRGETDTLDKMAERVQFDLYYIRNWSLLMDIRIVAWTAFKGWTGNNAY